MYKGGPSFTHSDNYLGEKKEILICNIKGTVNVISSDPQFNGNPSYEQ